MLLRSIKGIAQIFTTPLSRIFQRDLSIKTRPNIIEEWPESLRVILKFWRIERGLLFIKDYIALIAYLQSLNGIARRTNRDQLYLGIQARSWSFRRGVRFEIESHMRTEHCQEEKEKLGAKIRVFQNTFHFKARTEESVMILLVWIKKNSWQI